MPGPVSDTYDPEWGTRANAEPIIAALDALYDRVSGVLRQKPPVYIGALVQQKDEMTTGLNATLSEWEWRVIRFALERAKESV